MTALFRHADDDPTFIDFDNCAIMAYKQEATSARQVLMLDQGEDRMLSTLLLENGWLLCYCSNAESYTYCPTTFKDFFIQVRISTKNHKSLILTCIQRRRWILSTLVNTMHVIGNSNVLRQRNSSISFMFIIYVFLTLCSSIFAPATAILVTMGGVSQYFSILRNGLDNSQLYRYQVALC